MLIFSVLYGLLIFAVLVLAILCMIKYLKQPPGIGKDSSCSDASAQDDSSNKNTPSD